MGLGIPHFSRVALLEHVSVCVARALRRSIGRPGTEGLTSTTSYFVVVLLLPVQVKYTLLVTPVHCAAFAVTLALAARATATPTRRLSLSSLSEHYDHWQWQLTSGITQAGAAASVSEPHWQAASGPGAEPLPVSASG